MTNRLTPEALDALLEEHQPRFSESGRPCVECDERSPCTIYLLASEVRDAREGDEKFLDELDDRIRTAEWNLAQCPTDCNDRSRALDRMAEARVLIGKRLAHYEEGAK